MLKTQLMDAFYRELFQGKDAATACATPARAAAFADTDSDLRNPSKGSPGHSTPVVSRDKPPNGGNKVSARLPARDFS